MNPSRTEVLAFFCCCWFSFNSFDSTDSYDGYTTCAKPFRASRGRVDFPCDFKNQNWCIIPGSAYPWHAVRRFVYENHGLMRRMYGEQRHISVLRAEIDSNDVDNTHEGWHGYHESPFKKYEKPIPTPLRQASFLPTSSTPASSSTTTNTTTTTASTVTTSSTNSNMSFAAKNLTYADTSYNNVTDDERNKSNEEPDEEEEEEGGEEQEDTTNSTESILETTTSSTTTDEQLPSSTSTSSNAETMLRTTQQQIYQETTSESPMYKLRGINACPVKQEVVAPFWANNTRGEILALLNLYPFEQYVHWERCTYENKQMYCRQGCRCEQQYRLHRLLAYDPTDDCRGIFSDWFKFPSCCVCKCYDLPLDLRITSRSPRSKEKKHTIPTN